MADVHADKNQDEWNERPCLRPHRDAASTRSKTSSSPPAQFSSASIMINKAEILDLSQIGAAKPCLRTCRRWRRRRRRGTPSWDADRRAGRRASPRPTRVPPPPSTRPTSVPPRSAPRRRLSARARADAEAIALISSGAR